MTIEDFLSMLLRNALLLLGLTILGGAAGYGLSYLKSPVYEATALGYVSASSEVDAEGNPVSQASGNMQFQYAKAQTYLPLFNTRAVGENIVQSLQLQSSPDAVAGSLQATLDPNAPIITVTAQAPSPERASAIANAAVEAAAAEARQLESGGNENARVSVQMVPYQTALTPDAPVSPDRPRYALIGAVLGLSLGLILSWLRSRHDSRVRTVEDVERTVGLSTLGVLPDLKELTRDKDGPLPEPKSFAAREALRKMRTNLQFIDVDNPPRAIVVTSSFPGEGKSTVSGNLARVMARAGHRTLLIDADMRRPVVAKEFGLDGTVGLSQLLAGSVTPAEVIQQVENGRLHVLVSGQVPPNPSELLGSRRMQELIAELRQNFFVIIDAPPVLAVTDGQLLARHADGAVLVAVPGRTRVESLRRAAVAMQNVQAKVFGVVLNRASTSRINRIAYGDAEYGYGYGVYGSYSYGSKGYADASRNAQIDEIEVADPVTPDAHRAEDGEQTSTSGGRRARRVLPTAGDSAE
ncbi:polysaccharide biosynthesis tyrosine autokinase [Brachybacterium sp. EF45031]|uniref:polysaccharide biosynthesis tyrosine autokinase n=1 Tax=Brachybacterium sillae TaxID=2810536 RepID=UPI00217ED1A4|nr:polysaccharide biosynthesis tyrosine autokinase [Brachybacterium sillae]MCS6711642.1 polysaccharide biosynthesis tyrosine autokinase [Brachybacterium sillae]